MFRTTNDPTVNWLQYKILQRNRPVECHFKKIMSLFLTSVHFVEDSEPMQHVFVKRKKFCYTGKIAPCEFHVKRVSREFHVNFSREIHVKFT